MSALFLEQITFLRYENWYSHCLSPALSDQFCKSSVYRPASTARISSLELLKVRVLWRRATNRSTWLVPEPSTATYRATKYIEPIKFSRRLGQTLPVPIGGRCC